MTTRQLRQHEMLFRVSAFGMGRRGLFPRTTRAARAFAAVDDAVSELNRRAVAQLAAKQEGARTRRAARAVLTAMLRSIHCTARVIREEQRHFPNTFHLPERRTAQALLTAARLAARSLEAVVPAFIEFGTSHNVATDFKNALETYERAARRQEVGKGESAAARVNTQTTIRVAMTAVRQLDVIVANTLRDDVAAMAEWTRSRRLRSAESAERAEGIFAAPESAESAERAEGIFAAPRSAESAERAEGIFAAPGSAEHAEGAEEIFAPRSAESAERAEGIFTAPRSAESAELAEGIFAARGSAQSAEGARDVGDYSAANRIRVVERFRELRFRGHRLFGPQSRQVGRAAGGREAWLGPTGARERAG